MGSCDETKFCDPRNRAETELPYTSTRSGPLVGPDLNLIDFEPRLAALAGAFSWNTMAKIDDILIFCCVSGFLAGVIVAVKTLPV
jgi:hypothetical protein